MAMNITVKCKECDDSFYMRYGPLKLADQLICDSCGRSIYIQNETNERNEFMKCLLKDKVEGEESTYRFDERMKVRGSSVERRARTEDSLDNCTCGGRFRYDAPLRCPECGSVNIEIVDYGDRMID